MEIFAHNGIIHQSYIEDVLHKLNDLLPVLLVVSIVIGIAYSLRKFVLAKEYIKIKREK